MLDAIMIRDILYTWQGDITEWGRHAAPRLIGIIVVAFILLQLLKAATRKLEGFSQKPLHTGLRAQQLKTLASVIGSVGTVIIFFLAGMQILPLFGIDARPILASAGIVGLAVGFGAQTLVKDVINGFFILFENQYDIGDVVKIAGVSGGVEQVTLRHTLLRDANGTVHLIPNSEIKVVSNMTRDWSQVQMNVLADYSESSERVTALLNEVGQEMYRDSKFAEMLVAEPEVLGIERVSGQEVEYLMTAKVTPGKQWAIARELRRRIKQKFDENQIRVPAPAKAFVASLTGGEKQEVK